MNTKTMMIALAVAALAFGGFAAESKPDGTVVQKPVQLEEKDDDFPVSAEAELALDSKYLSYGFVDDNRPILSPSAAITFFDLIKFDIKALFDVTKNGRRAGYHNRAWQYIELDPGAHLVHEFKTDDLGTISLDLGYLYEYHPRSMGKFYGGDTQFVTFSVEMEDLLLEPVFYFERDIQRDNGTYVNLELGHTFALIEKDEDRDEDPLTFKLSVAQGFGNTQRVAGYLVDAWGRPMHHGGLMDTMFKATLTWNITDNFYFSGYVAYSDFLFDRNIRDASRDYEASGRWDESYNFIGGLAAGFSF